MSTQLKVVVVGAGVSGLIAARELKKESHEVVVLEKADRLGGLWVYDPRIESDLLGLNPDREIVHASAYKSLRTNSPRQIMGYSDYTFEGKNYGDPRMFPRREEILMYLEDFAEKFGVTKLIRFNSEVTRVELLDFRSKEFVVGWKTNSGTLASEIFDAVVVCNGHNTQPRVAIDIPGCVVIGNGSSAYDISREVATVANEVHLSSRSLNVKVSKLDTYDNIWQHSKTIFRGVNSHGYNIPASRIAVKVDSSSIIREGLLKEMLHDVEQICRQMEEKGISKLYTHSLNYQMDYLDWLSDQLGTPPPSQKVKDIYADFVERFRNNHELFREAFEEDFLVNF